MFRVQLQVEDGGSYRIRQVTAPALIASCGQAVGKGLTEVEVFRN